MKLIPKLILWILLITINLKSFSQTAIDSTTIQFKEPIVRLIIKDLIKGDGAKQKVQLFGDKINILNQKLVLKDSIILNLNSQILNNKSLFLTKTKQLEISQNLSLRLEQDLKKQKLKTKIFQYGSGITLVGIIILSISN